jgi:hypothetical protein
MGLCGLHRPDDEPFFTAARFEARLPRETAPTAIDPKTAEIKVYANLRVVESDADALEEISLAEAREQDPSVQVGDVMQTEVTPEDFDTAINKVLGGRGIRGADKGGVMFA